MTTINKVLMVGRVVRAPEVVERNNFKFTKITIVTEYTPKGRDGEQKKETCYLDCTVWNHEADFAAKHLVSGSVIAVEGRLKLEKWMDKATNLERTKHVLVADSVTFLEKIKTDESVYAQQATADKTVRDEMSRPEEVQKPVRQFTKAAPAQAYQPQQRTVQQQAPINNPADWDELPF